MLRKNVLFTIAAILMLSLAPSPVLAETAAEYGSPALAPMDCGVWAYAPARSGSVVNGKGEVSCATNHASLRVVAGIRDWTGRYISQSKTCYNAKICTVTASLSYSPGRQWQTDVSGYVSDISWSAYYATAWKAIP